VELFGLSISRAPKRKGGNFQPVPVSGGGWWPIIREPFTGAWQRNQEERADTLLTHSAVFACATLIASDIAKMNLRLVKQDADGIWEETSSPSFSPVLQRPNHYQNRIKFIEWWIISKLIHGNTYALKARDNRGVVTALYILDPARVRVLLAPDGSVFYSLGVDVLNGLTEPVVVPAREIIHDIMVALYHPLLGVSPIFACAMAAIQGLRIQANSTRFFANGSNPGGVLSAPGEISQPTADRIKAYWDTNFTGDNVGKIAVLGDGLKYEPMTVNAHDAQLIEQLKWTVETVCSCFHVPAYMIGGALPPNYNNIEALNQQYYSQCLQALIESLELCLDEGLDLPDKYDTQFDLDDLLRMDTATMITSEKDAIGAGIKKPNESRRRLNLKPVDGGDTPYLQQQNYSLAALAKRDAKAGAPDTPAGTPAATPAPADGGSGDTPPMDEAAAVAAWRIKAAALGLPVAA